MVPIWVPKIVPVNTSPEQIQARQNVETERRSEYNVLLLTRKLFITGSSWEIKNVLSQWSDSTYISHTPGHAYEQLANTKQNPWFCLFVCLFDWLIFCVTLCLQFWFSIFFLFILSLLLVLLFLKKNMKLMR